MTATHRGGGGEDATREIWTRPNVRFYSGTNLLHESAKDQAAECVPSEASSRNGVLLLLSQHDAQHRLVASFAPRCASRLRSSATGR